MVAAGLPLGLSAGAQNSTAPARPTGLSATAAAHDAVSLSWDDPGDASITHYRVHRRVPGVHDIGVFVDIEDNTATAHTAYTDTGVAPETKYVYRVTAVNGHGDSQWSKYASTTTLAAPQPEPDETVPDEAQDPDETDPDETDPDEAQDP